MPDEIIEELWGIKASIAREHGNDAQKLAAYLQSKRDDKSTRVTDLDAMNELSDAGHAIKSAGERLS